VEASHLAALGVDSRLVHVLDHQSVSVPTQRARALVAHHLVRDKRIESDLPRGFYDPPRRRDVVRATSSSSSACSSVTRLRSC